jgi:hypothetical protein
MVAIPDRLDSLGDYIALLRSRFDEPEPDHFVAVPPSPSIKESSLSSQALDSSTVSENAKFKNKAPLVSSDAEGQGLTEPQPHQSLTSASAPESCSLHLDSTLVETSVISESPSDVKAPALATLSDVGGPPPPDSGSSPASVSLPPFCLDRLRDFGIRVDKDSFFVPESARFLHDPDSPRVLFVFFNQSSSATCRVEFKGGLKIELYQDSPKPVKTPRGTVFTPGWYFTSRHKGYRVLVPGKHY